MQEQLKTMSTTDFANSIIQLFDSHSDMSSAKKMSAYMKNQFVFYGISASLRRELMRDVYALNGIPDEAYKIAQILWAQPQRELHYVAQELLMKAKKQWRLEHIEDIEHLLIINSWWDTIDFLASNVVGEYFRKWPEHRKEVILKWNTSENMWLVRTSILFQLKYKEDVDTDLLTACILPHAQQSEFFIKKAIGWSLRQYAKYNPDWVSVFLSQHSLQKLSIKEARKYL